MRKKKMEKEIGSTVREKVADKLDMSKEIILDFAKVVFIGNREVTVENYKSIVEYTETKIILETKPHRLKFEGQSLEVKTITREMLYIMGKISKLEFQKEA